MIHFIHRTFRLRSITSRFFFWFFLLIILLSSIYVLSYSHIDKKKQLEEAKGQLEHSLSTQRQLLRNWVDERFEEVRLLANFPVTKQGNIDVMAERFAYYHQSYDKIDAIVYIDKEGYVQIDTAYENVIVENPSVSLKDRPYFIASEQGDEDVCVVVSKQHDEPTVIFSSPVHTLNEQFQGVLFSAVHLSVIDHLLANTLRGDSHSITLLNSDGYIVSQLAHESPETNRADILNTKANPTILNEMRGKESGILEYENNQGEKMIGAFTSLCDGNFTLINEVSEKEVLETHRQMVSLMLFILFGIILLGLVLSIIISKQLLRPFSSLVKAMDEVKDGDYETKLNPQTFVTSPIELQQLMHRFNEMVVSINQNKTLLQRLSSTDGLTGVANRRLFEEELENEWNIAKERQQPLSLVFFDVDYFKEYNDTFGHQEGDRCLVKIAQSVQYLMKGQNRLVFRYGGEEFVIILPNTTSEEATDVAEQVRNRVKELQIPRLIENEEEIVTISIGVATTIPTDKETKSDLIQLADQAVYEAKSQGRNRVVIKR